MSASLQLVSCRTSVQYHQVKARGNALTVWFVSTLAASVSAQTTWKRVSTFDFDWNGYKGVRVVLEIPDPWSAPGDFTRIRIRVPGRKTFALSNKNGWVKFGSNEGSRPSKALVARNIVSSPYTLALRVAENRTALFLFGYAYASSPGSLDVLELSEGGEPRVVLHREELGLADVHDLDADGIADVAAYPCLSEEFGDGLRTYDPFHAYKLDATPAANAKLSLPLSKAYTLEHYYGWAGTQCREDVVVVLHPPKGGRPLVMSRQAAEKLRSTNPK